MINIQRIKSVHIEPDQEYKVTLESGQTVGSREDFFQPGELAFVLPAGSIIPAGIAKQLVLHRQKAQKQPDGKYKLLESAVVKVGRLFPTEPKMPGVGFLKLEPGSVDFSSLIGVQEAPEDQEAVALDAGETLADETLVSEVPADKETQIALAAQADYATSEESGAEWFTS